MGISATDISQRIDEAVLAPGARLGEQPLAMLFDCSRTIVRAALTRLAARGIDVGTRSFLLGDFHACLAECLAECLGNGPLAEHLAHVRCPR